ncbi:MAG: hypothetical protein R3293_22735, partial [Candidatus Promineifilaceae bacterium]|nr:hypothetical protein [Candidatus Promineifilaceae bacterium]
EHEAFFPLIMDSEASCEIAGQSYQSLPVTGSSTNPQAANHPDLNIGLRGYELTDAELKLVTLGEVWDRQAPQLPALFADNRVPQFSNAYHRYRWDWDCQCPTDTYSPWDTTLLGMAVTPGEIIHVPDSGYDIGGGYEVMVLYAGKTRITFHIGNSDKLDGYVMHVEDVCIEPDLLAKYNTLHEQGRDRLPVLKGRQPFGRALGSEIKVAMRDNGHFLDPRSRNSWWIGR